MKLVVCFPGIGYHCDKPLLYYSRKLAACAGYDHTLLLQYTYHKDGLRGSPAALREAFDTLYAQAEAQLSAVDWPQYDDVLFLSKSIGTAVSAAFAQRHGIPCRQILYTPLSLTFALAPQNALAFLGTADPWSDASSVAAAARANGTPLCLYAVSYTHLRAHETDSYLVCRLLLEKKKDAVFCLKKKCLKKKKYTNDQI